MTGRSSPLFLILFCISGVCALIYEVVWTRLFTVVIGNTVFSISAVLIVFMAGLALGSWAAGRYVDRKAIPLFRAYALLEAGIGLYNLLLPALLKGVDPLFGLLYASASQTPLALGFARLAVSFALLIVPATLMGATFPIFVRSYVENIADAGAKAGRVYTVNTLGAALGTAAAGFLLVPYAGVLFALRVAAGLNLGVAAAAWLASRTHTAHVPARREGNSDCGPRIVLVGMFLSGCAALMNEVAWTRVLGLVVGPTTYAFTLMLCSIIAGLGLGAAAGSFWVRRRPVRASTFLAVQVGIGVTSLALLPAFGRLPLWIGELVVRHSASFATMQILEFLIFFALMLIPTTLMGVSFPIASRLYVTSDAALGAEISAIYSFNTIGGIVGALVAGFILIPSLGSQSTLMAAAALSVATGALIGGAFKQWAAAAVALLLGVTGLVLIPEWNPALMASGAYKYANYFAQNLDLESELTSGELLYFKEGAATTVSAKKHGGRVILSIDGKADASDASDMTTQKMLAHLPLLLSADARNVAIIGLGSGVTAGSALRHPIEKLDVVEISPEVAEASRFFSHVNHNALSDPRTHLIIGDGRNHLRYSKQQYDVIISEPSNPWMAGLASLFTRQFFSEAKARLTPNGIHCQWFHNYNMSLDDLRTIIATFRTEFPHAMLWSLNESDFVLLGSSSPLVIDEAVFQRNFDRVAQDLNEVKIQDAYSVLSLLVLQDEELDQFSRGAGLNTDDLPVLEFRAPRFIHADTIDENIAALQASPRTVRRSAYVEQVLAAANSESHRRRGEMFLAAAAYREAAREFRLVLASDINDRRAWKGLVAAGRDGASRPLLATFFDEMVQTQPLNLVRLSAADFYYQTGNYPRTVELADAVLKEDPKNIEALEKMADALANQGSNRLDEIAERLVAADPENANGIYHLATIRVYQNRLDEAIQMSRRLLERDPQDVRARGLLAIAYGRTFQPDLAEAQFRETIQRSPPDFVSNYTNNYAFFLLDRNRIREAREQFQYGIRMNPENVEGFIGMGEAYRQEGNLSAARNWYRRALQMQPDHPIALQFVRD